MYTKINEKTINTVFLSKHYLLRLYSRKSVFVIKVAFILGFTEEDVTIDSKKREELL